MMSAWPGLQRKTSEIDVTLSQRNFWPQVLVNSQLNYGYSNHHQRRGRG